MAIMAVAVINSINIAYAPDIVHYDIAPVATEATQTEETNEFVERALQVSEGYDFVEYINITENEVIYIVEDSDGVQFKVAYSEANGKPVSGITLYNFPQN